LRAANFRRDLEVRLGPREFVLDGDPARPHQEGGVFGPCSLRPNGWMDEASTWHGDRPQPGDFVLDGDPVPFPKKGRRPPPQIFGPLVLWRNGCMHQKSSAVAEMGDRGHNRHGPKREGVEPFRGALGTRLIQGGLRGGLLPYQVASSSIHPFGHNSVGYATRCVGISVRTTTLLSKCIQ